MYGVLLVRAVEEYLVLCYEFHVSYLIWVKDAEDMTVHWVH